MDIPKWVPKAAVLDLHEEQRLAHGGPAGLRDDGLLDSALDRPRNLVAYGSPDFAALAAAYAFGLAKNHPFVDGNKRVSFLTTELFLGLNGFELTATDDECIVTWLALAAGGIDEAAMASWLRAKCQPTGAEELAPASRLTAEVRGDRTLARVRLETRGEIAAVGVFDAAGLEEAIRLLADARAMLEPSVPPRLAAFDGLRTHAEYRWHVEDRLVGASASWASRRRGWAGSALRCHPMMSASS